MKVELWRREVDPLRGAATQGDAQADLSRNGELVRSLLEQINRELPGGHGSAWETNVTGSLRMWELSAAILVSYPPATTRQTGSSTTSSPTSYETMPSS